jgi:hypothetical protein
MTKAAIKFNGIMGIPKILADDSLRINVTSSTETTDENFLDFLKLRKTLVDIFIKPTEDEITKLVEIDGIKKKTPSQRLRGVLYILWKQLSEVGDFAAYYKSEMEKIMNHYKNKLNWSTKYG